jgi:hypothetical protein
MRGKILAILVAGLALAPWRLFAVAVGFELAGGPNIGLDRFFRGGELEAAVTVDGSASGAAVCRGLGLGLSLGLRYDGTLGNLSGTASLGLLIGRDFICRAGSELPLGQASLREPRSGAKATLLPSGFLSSIAFEARLFDISPGGRGSEEAAPGSSPKPRVLAVGVVSWSAYRVASIEGAYNAEALSKSLCGLLGFEACFRAAILVRLVWGG